ncbi:MAG: caspase family protein [Bacteroidota bacterium]
MSNRSLYALLVAIDKYLPPVPALDGCVNDMHAMRDHLVSRAEKKGFDLKMEVLENEQATRLNIVQKFEQHLGQAGKDDIVFFYYSGHGSQEPAHSLFAKIEEDSKLETLVCYDSRQFDGMDLADKELATLLSVVAQKDPHIIVITDCCNSGGATRSTDPDQVKVRETPMTKQERSLDAFILPRDMSSDRSVLTHHGTETLMIPESRHIQLSATHSHQLAKETYLGGSPRGVFTYSLLEVLEQSVGKMSYSDVLRRVQQLVRQRTYDQDPQIYASQIDDINLLFFDGLSSLERNYYTLSHKREDGWYIDAGMVHGIVGGSFTGQQSILSVFAEDAPEAEMDNPQMALGKVSVKEVRAEKSLVRLEGDLWLDQGTSYRCRIYDMPVKGIKVSFHGDPAGLQILDHAFQEDELAQAYVKKAGQTEEADYNVFASSKQQYIVSRATDLHTQALIRQGEGFLPATAAKVVEDLEHIAKWQQIAELRNPGSGLASGSIGIELMDPVEDRPVIATGGEFIFPYSQTDFETNGKEVLPAFRIKLTNRSGQKLFCSLLYMSPEFEINPNMLPQGGIWLDAGAESWAMNGRVLRGIVPEAWQAFGQKETTSQFKVIFSTVDFNGNLLRMKPLDLPKPVNERSGKVKTSSRSLLFDDDFSKAFNDWNTQTLSILIRQTD